METPTIPTRKPSTNHVAIRTAIVATAMLVGTSASVFLWTSKKDTAPTPTTAVATTVPSGTRVYQVADAASITTSYGTTLTISAVTPADGWTIKEINQVTDTEVSVTLTKDTTTTTFHAVLINGLVYVDTQTVIVWVERSGGGTYTPPPTTAWKPVVTPTTVRATTTTVRSTTTTTTTTTTRDWSLYEIDFLEPQSK